MGSEPPGLRLERLGRHRSGTVDVHTHAIDPRLADLAATFAGSFPSMRATAPDRAEILLDGRVYREVDERCWSAAARLRDMDAEGVAAQLVSPVPITLVHDQPAEGAAVLCRAQNGFLADLVAQAPDRLFGLGCVPLQDVEAAAAELRRCVGELGFAGVEVGSRVGARELADPALDPFFAAAEELGAVVFVHPVDRTLDPRLARTGLGFGVGMPAETATAAAALVTGDFFDRHPGLRVVLAHGGGALPVMLPRISLGQQVIAGVSDPERLATARARRLWCDSLTYDPASLALAVERFGLEHVVLGTDYPFTAREEPAGAVLAAAAGRLAGVEDIGRRNALALLEGVRTSPVTASPSR